MKSPWLWRGALLLAMLLLHGATGAVVAALNDGHASLAARLLIWLPAVLLYLLSAFVLLLAPLSALVWLRLRH